ncbi:MAG TPA: phasin family protein [Thermoanaerobaculia bacterium]|nr:phasin family protein [Thermoanaerobaculia bacterium]
MAKKTKDLTGDAAESAHKIWLAGLGALAVAEEEGSKLFRNLVSRGERFEKRGKEGLGRVKSSVEDVTTRARKSAGDAWERVGGSFDQKVTETLQRLGVPSRAEIAGLGKRVEELTRSVDQLRQQERAAKGKAAAPKVGTSKDVKTTGSVSTR